VRVYWRWRGRPSWSAESLNLYDSKQRTNQKGVAWSAGSAMSLKHTGSVLWVTEQWKQPGLGEDGAEITNSCYLFTCPPIYVSVHLSTHPVTLSSCLPFLSTQLSIHSYSHVPHPHIHAYTHSSHPPIHPYIHSSIYPSHPIHPSIHPSIHPIRPSAHPSIHSSINPSIPSTHLPIHPKSLYIGHNRLRILMNDCWEPKNRTLGLGI